MYGQYNPLSYRSIITLGALVALSIVSSTHTVRADFKDDIDFNKLKAEYGSGLPTGSGVQMAQIEYTRGGFWAPFAGGELVGKNFNYVTSLFGGYSSHGSEVAAYLGGTATSITPGLSGWWCFEATNYCAQQSLMAGRSLPPLVATWDIENHSWGGNDMMNGLTNLQRMDLRIERDNVVAVVGIDNGGTMSQMMANAYNVISVGTSTADHPHNGSTMEVRGRIKPELVGTATWTSYATPIVSSCATLLVDEIKRTPSLSAARSPLAIKALLMAGATKTEFPDWQHTPARPLDTIYGAGEVNIYNSYKALVAGRQQPVAATPLAVSGWDTNTTSSSRRLYYFAVPSGQTLSLSAVLAWNRHVQPDFYWQAPVSILHNLELVLWRADGSYNLQSKVAESISPIDNVEHIYESVGAGVYALEVIAPVENETYGLAWSGVLSGGSSTPPPAPPPASPAPTGFGDPSFEALSVGSNSFYAFAYNPGGTAWTFSNASGLTGNNSGFTSQNPAAPEGAQVGFIQMTGAMEQVVTLTAGTYTITAQAAQRGVYQYQNQTVDVYVDGSKAGSFSPAGTAYVGVSTGSFTVGDGQHTVRFVGKASQDSTLFIDKIALAASAAPTPPATPPPASVVDGGFESPHVGSNSFSAFAYNPDGTAWTFSARSGVAGNNSGFTSGNPGAPEGGQVSFIQMTGSIQQSVSLSAGTYTISAQAAQRSTYQQQNQTVDVYIDGQKVGTFAPSGTGYSTVSTNAFTVSDGTHTLRFVGTAALDGTVFMDNVAIQSGGSASPETPASSPVAVSGSGFEAPGVGSNSFYAFAYNPGGSAWSFAGSSGVTGNNSGFTQNNAAAPEGAQAAFLQKADSVISQSLSFSSTGTHTLIVSAARRGGPWNEQLQVVHVYLDTTFVGSFCPTDTNYQSFTLSFGANAGSHGLSFRGTVGADATAFLDDVVIIGP